MSASDSSSAAEAAADAASVTEDASATTTTPAAEPTAAAEPGSTPEPAAATEPAATTRRLPPDVSVVIPAFNEHEGVGPTVRELHAVLESAGLTFEIIVVDDGSTDGTGDAASASGARVIRLAANSGYGAALKTGIAASSSPLVAITDADATYPPEALPLLLEKAAEVDMVVGARPADFSNVPLVRRPGKRFLTRLASFLAGTDIPDLNSGLRVLRKPLVEQFFPILPAGFSFTMTVTLALLCTEHRVAWVPIEYRPRVGRSKLRALDFTKFLILVLRTILLFNPLKVFLPLGGMVFVAGVAKLVYDVFLWNLSESAVMAFLTAVILWTVGLLADMIARLQLGAAARYR